MIFMGFWWLFVNDIHDLHNVPDHGICGRNVQGKVGQSVLSSVLVCLPLNFCPTFPFLFSSA